MTLPDTVRYRLLNGPYHAPRCRVGGRLTCKIRGRVRVAAMSGGSIQWPMAISKNGKLTLIICGDLARAIQNESNQAVANAWGISEPVVSSWRRILGVPPSNKGTYRLRSLWWHEGGIGEASRPGLAASQASLERRAKIAASKKGKPRPPHVIEAMRKANLGRRASAETRAKLSASAKANGAWPPAAGRPFTPDEDALLGTATDKEIAESIGRHWHTVVRRRSRLGIARFRSTTLIEDE